MSEFLHGLKGGETMDVAGPTGNFTLKEPLARDVVFVATGSGIAPLRSMIGHLLPRGTRRTVYLVFGSRSEEDILYRSEWENLQGRYPHFRLFLTLSQPGPAWPGLKGHVQDVLEGFILDFKANDYYVCGSKTMIQQTQQNLLSKGVPEKQINFEM